MGGWQSGPHTGQGRQRVHSRYRLWARLIARDCVRNTYLEDLHAGMSPSSVTGDYRDVKVVSPYGEIPWTEVSRISDPEMRRLMLEVEARLTERLEYFATLVNDPVMLEAIKKVFFGPQGVSWDRPGAGRQRPGPRNSGDPGSRIPDKPPEPTPLYRTLGLPAKPRGVRKRRAALLVYLHAMDGLQPEQLERWHTARMEENAEAVEAG